MFDALPCSGRTSHRKWLQCTWRWETRGCTEVPAFSSWFSTIRPWPHPHFCPGCLFSTSSAMACSTLGFTRLPYPPPPTERPPPHVTPTYRKASGKKWEENRLCSGENGITRQIFLWKLEQPSRVSLMFHENKGVQESRGTWAIPALCPTLATSSSRVLVALSPKIPYQKAH